MIYESPCYPCDYNFYSVDEFGDCKEDICTCPKEELKDKCWIEQWAKELAEKRRKNE